MSVYLVRHARAGSRRGWKGADDLRPLSKVGRKQATGLSRTLAEAGVTRIVSSPFVRCVQTVAPLGKRLDVEVELTDALAEGAALPPALRLIEKLLDQEAVLCSHGDVLGLLLEHFTSTGVLLDGDKLKKASTWVLDGTGGEVRQARYVPPPKP